MRGQIGSGFAFAWLAALGLIVAAFIGLNAWMGKPAGTLAAKPETIAASPVPESASRQTTETAPSVSLPPTLSVPPVPLVALPKTISQDPVTVADLDHLASAVHLREPTMGASREVWASQLPVAQSLLQRPCDCDERNWLNHYVKTASEALAGSEDYSHSIQLLATLRRSNQDLTASVQAPH